jgi:hypothetical protein
MGRVRPSDERRVSAVVSDAVRPAVVELFIFCTEVVTLSTVDDLPNLLVERDDGLSICTSPACIDPQLVVFPCFSKDDDIL